MFFLALWSSAVLAQQVKTPYEKKVEMLRKSFFSDLGYTQAQINQMMNKNASGTEAIIYTSDLMNKLQTPKGRLRYERLKRDLKEAKKLKNKTDFAREKAPQQKEEEKKQLVIQKRREELKKEKATNSDKYKIQSEVSEKIQIWLQKGEFEKTEDFKIRVSEKFEEAFKEICYQTFEDRIKNEAISLELKEYNADKEHFKLFFIRNDYRFTSLIKVPSEKAPEFKDNFSSLKMDFSKSEWLFDDGYLLPNIFYIDNYEALIFTNEPKSLLLKLSELDLKISKDISIPFNLLFDYSVIVKEKIKKQEALLEIEKQKTREKELALAAERERLENERKIVEEKKKEEEKRKEAQKKVLIARKDSLETEYEKSKTKTEDLIRFLQAKIEKKKNNLGSNLLSAGSNLIATNKKEKKSNTEIFYEQLKNYLYKQDNYLKYAYNFLNQSNEYLTEIELEQQKQNLKKHQDFIQKAFIIAYDGSNHPDWGKVKVNKSFYDRIENAYGNNFYNLVLEENIPKK
ncbi:MAG: hypothetical protein SFU27_05860 [Thermonemataceae bacterium]|nr:hypothetical protein [Thermonemataceae bacterium]